MRKFLRSRFRLFRRSRPVRPPLTEQYPDIIEPDFMAACELSRPATMTSVERLYALHHAVRHVVQADLPGAFVECGVWKGGSAMMMALTLKSLGVTNRDIVLFDTFQGMTPPGQEDIDHEGKTATALLARGDRDKNLFWAYSPIEEATNNLRSTGYPMKHIHLVVGDVMETIPVKAPEAIALLRLDTDWYESTRHELEFLFPRLVSRGVLIIDDYGHFRGARKAVDEYFATQPLRYFLQRIDYSGRMLTKS
jgi:O-methyltransferase